MSSAKKVLLSGLCLVVVMIFATFVAEAGKGKGKTPRRSGKKPGASAGKTPGKSAARRSSRKSYKLPKMTALSGAPVRRRAKGRKVRFGNDPANQTMLKRPITQGPGANREMTRYSDRLTNRKPRPKKRRKLSPEQQAAKKLAKLHAIKNSKTADGSGRVSTLGPAPKPQPGQTSSKAVEMTSKWGEFYKADAAWRAKRGLPNPNQGGGGPSNAPGPSRN